MANFTIILSIVKSNSPISTARGKSVVRQFPTTDEPKDLEHVARVAALMSKDHRACVLVSRLQGTYHVVGCDDESNGGFTPEVPT